MNMRQTPRAGNRPANSTMKRKFATLARMKRLFLWAFVLILLASSAWQFGASAQQTPAAAPADASSESAFFNSFRWRNVGPDRGGRSIAVSGVKGRSKEAYFG